MKNKNQIQKINKKNNPLLLEVDSKLLMNENSIGIGLSIY